MIIGDGIVLSVGGESASIVVNAPTGSTVTCTTPKGTVLTAAEVSGTWKFARLKSYGTYTITATNGTHTKTQNVVVNSANVFNIEMDYKLWLYKDGDYYTDITGGFYSNTTWYSSSNWGTITKNGDNSITFSCPNGYYFIGYATNLKIDVSDFSTLNLNVVNENWIGTGYRSMYLLSDANSVNTSVGSTGFNATGIRTIDVSGLTGSYYVLLCGNSQSDGACTMTFDKIWLE